MWAVCDAKLPILPRRPPIVTDGLLDVFPTEVVPDPRQFFLPELMCVLGDWSVECGNNH
jgi:hypothetical protein